MAISKKIDSIQALRGIASLGIILHHTGFVIFNGLGAWGVSIFFVLSGFLLVYNYYMKNRFEEIKIKNNILFAYKKMGIYVYVLHILMSIASSVFWFIGSQQKSFFEIIIKFGLNVLLLQEWVPISERSINGTSWFLSSILFCYFVFPYILKYCEKRMHYKKAIYSILTLFIIQVLFGIVGSCIFAPLDIISEWIESDLSRWFIYCFPFTRSLDFAIGCCLGYLFINRDKDNYIEKKSGVLSVIAFVLIIVANALVVLCELDIVSRSIDKWWTYSVIFTGSSCMLIYLVARNESKIGKLITNRIMLYLGNVSSYIFLIHFVVFLYIETGLGVLFGYDFSGKYSSWIKLILGIPISLIANKIWMMIIKKDVKF